MLPARHRLRQSVDFAGTVRGVRSGDKLLVVHARRTDARAGLPPRVGFVVSKAVGNAVVRNRTKRRLRALMSARVEQLPGGVDLVVRANPAAALTTSARLDTALSAVLTTVVGRVSARSPGADGARERPATQPRTSRTQQASRTSLRGAP